MIEQGLVNLIQGDPAVAAIASHGGGFLAELEKNQQLPSWSYIFAGGRTDHTLQGERGPRHRRMQIDCYGYSAFDALSLAQAIDNVLENFSGTVTDGAPSPTALGYVLSALMEQEPADTFDASARTWRRMLEYDIFFQ